MRKNNLSLLLNKKREALAALHIHDFTASRAISGKRGHTAYSGRSIPMDSRAPTWNCRLPILPPSLRIFYEKENRRNNPLPTPQTDALQPGWTIVLITIRHDTAPGSSPLSLKTVMATDKAIGRSRLLPIQTGWREIISPPAPTKPNISRWGYPKKRSPP